MHGGMLRTVVLHAHTGWDRAILLQDILLRLTLFPCTLTSCSGLESAVGPNVVLYGLSEEPIEM